jgi:2-polyprenyl-3-methyl-5-hydroxy-6-metoxy-1,4-benzoquinol methylase
MTTPGEFEVLSCPRCGAGTTLPLKSADELAAYYPSGYQAYEATEGGTLGAISRAIRAWQAFSGFRTPPLSTLRERSPGRAVDVGCGRGDLGAALIERGWTVTGVEPSPDACKVAAGRGIDARCGNVAAAGLEEESYDVASLRHSLEHVSDPVGDLGRIARALRPGGLVLITVPNFGGWQSRRFGSRWYHLDLPRHRVHFTQAALCTALESAGLRVAGVSTSTSTVGLPASAQYAIAGRCLFPTGMALRVASAACVLAYPVAWPLDRLGGGDQLHAVAYRVRG